MNRRSFLASGLGAVAGAGLLAGCLGDSSDSGDGGETVLPGTSPDPSTSPEGLAPNPEDVDVPGIDPDAIETKTTRDVEVPLLPIDVAHPWYLAREARFVDARSRTAYERSHVAGAALSPQPTGFETDDPTADWPKSDRIVTYCTCPHHYSTSRAAGLIENGFENVYALDEGFGPWFERGYPVASASDVQTAIGESRAISGRVDPAYAGEFVRLRHEPTGQREPGEIAGDGSFEVTFRFVEVDADSVLTLETPAWTRTGTLSEFTSGTVR